MNNTDFKCDTTRLTEDADELIELVTMFNDEIFQFYRKFEFMSYDQNAWAGKSAKSYYSMALREKKEYDEYALRLKNVARSLKDYAYYLEATVNKNENNIEDSFKRG